jgi:hypothetical protein
MVSGATWVAKGGLIMPGIVDLGELLIVAELFFAEDGLRTPFPFNVTYFVGTLALFVGLMLLGIAALRTEALPSRWKLLPLVVGLSGLFAVWVLALVYLELPVVALGLTWILPRDFLWSSVPGKDGLG